MTPEISIIIISYNTSKITKRCLDTVVASLESAPKLEAEIMVVDNASTDDSKEMLQEYASKIAHLQSNIKMRCIYSKENLGFGRANNLASHHTEAKYLLFLNSDTETLNDAIPQLLKLFKKSDFAFAGAKLLNKDRSTQLSVGRFYTLPIAAIALFALGDRFHITRYSPNHIKKVDWVSGACFITTKKNYNELHGFDPEIFMYWEEVDLFYRARLKNLTTGFFQQPTFIHLEGASSKSRTQPILKVFEGYIHFYKKHYSPLQVTCIRYMLQLKSLVSLYIGKLLGNRYLIETYSQAYEIAQKN